VSAAIKQEEIIFHEAVKLTDIAQRNRFLDEACAGNAAVRAGVEKLLAAHEVSERFFDADGSALSWTVKSLQTGTSAGASNENPFAELLSDEPSGTRIGRYKILQRIGEGGCGVVYMAEQQEPVRRRVALKIIKLGMETKNVIARFEAERQALALMDHPSIARVLDAGATATGRPYFVMELVPGVKITEFCNQNRFDTRQRLELFVQICHAVQHAHQKGIIHRDLKPSNIMVTLLDGIPVPKVIDFGIAKATEEQLTDKTFFTIYGHFIGTPAYMSPEQAEMSGLDIDTRSDIYSLGVLLYELLTGRTPFDGNKLLQGGLDEMRRTLREKEPPRPSTIVTTLQATELKVAAEQRHAEPLKLISLLRGDLDWIVMKALEKDRRRRYETADGLAMDIQRYLNNEPVIARPPSRLYRLQKLVHRNKVVFAAGASVVMVLIIGLSVSTWLFFKEREAERQQTLLRQEAEITSARETELRRQAELREKITQASFAISQGRMEDADQAIRQVSNAPPSLESAAVFRRLGEWHALNGRWQQASERFATLVNVNRFDGLDAAASDALECAASMAELGNLDAYDRFREAMVDRFAANPNHTASDRIVKAALMLPAADRFLQTLKPVIETITSKIPPTIRAQPPAEALNVAAAESGSNVSVPVSKDTNPPVITDIVSYDGLSVEVKYDKLMDSTTTTNPANYRVDGAPVVTADFVPTGQSVVLRLGQPINGQVMVTVNNVKDFFSNTIVPETKTVGSVLPLQLLTLGDASQQPYSASYSGGGASIIAGGSNILGGSDNLVYQYLVVTNDFDFRLRVQSVSGGGGAFARSGLMARDSLHDVSSHQIMVAVNAGNTFQVITRTMNGSVKTQSQPPNPLPASFGSNSWVRLQRVGTIFRAYYGNNGVDWALLYQFDSAMDADGPFANPIYLGIATSSWSAQKTVKAEVSDFGVTQTTPVGATISLALIEYRRKNYTQAMEWCHRCLAYPDYQAARIATARAILAMCCFRLNQTAEAHAELAGSRDLILGKFAAGLDAGTGTYGYWFDWVAAQVLLREATDLIRDTR
jgi:serine/threonine protein kinase